MPLAARLWLKQVRHESWCQPTVRSEAAQQANGQVRGCPAGKFHRKQYPVKVITFGKIGQLSCLVSTFLSRAASRKQQLFTLEAASLCFQCNHLQSLT